MKNIIYFYNYVEGDEELHEDEEAAKKRVKNFP
jgi:hypothetical protein